MVASAIYKVADCFAVALVEEGVKLRLSGIDKDILVLIPPFIEDIPIAVEYGLTLAVDSIKILELLEKECEKQNASVRVHIKFNSGMNRLGVSLNELEDICKFLSRAKRVKLEGLFSHLACPENKRLTEKAVNNFLLAKSVVLCYNKSVVCHISASGGLIKGYQFDMVRIGIMLYGYKPFKAKFCKLERAMKVFAPAVLDRSIKKGESFLYGENLADKNINATIVRYGYADGGLRNGGYALVRNRCMDLSAIKKKAEFGRLCCVMNNADIEAKARGTISYEVLCACGKRSEKIYIN